MPEQGGPDTGQGNLKQHKILREHQEFASNALVSRHDIPCTPLQVRDLFSLSIKVVFVDVLSVVSQTGLHNARDTSLCKLWL